ncbi:unnamed protein product, partial [Ixodes pacificus]
MIQMCTSLTFWLRRAMRCPRTPCQPRWYEWAVRRLPKQSTSRGDGLPPNKPAGETAHKPASRSSIQFPSQSLGMPASKPTPELVWRLAHSWLSRPACRRPSESSGRLSSRPVSRTARRRPADLLPSRLGPPK